MNEHEDKQPRQSPPRFQQGRPKVVYIAGWGRSGSTILDQVLGQLEGWFSCGELNLIGWNLPCGCGRPTLECEFWGPVVSDVLERHQVADPTQLIAFQEQHLGTSPSTLSSIAREARGSSEETPLRRHAALISDLYATAAALAGARVLVDSSKAATDAYLIAALTDVELYVVHLVRDPRATAYAWSKSKVKTYEPLYYFGRLGPVRSSWRWLRRNAVIEMVLRRRLGERYLLLRYEDFVADPERAVRRICATAGEPVGDLPLTGPRTLTVQENHTVAGNPSRFRRGTVQIRADDEWRQRMTRRSRILAGATATPLMHRYGYTLRAR